MRRRIGTMLALLVLGCFGNFGCGPVWMLPGGVLPGAVQAAPDDWTFSDDVEIVQLETRPGDPYSVNVWGVGIGESFYVAAGDPANAWAQELAQNPDVRLKVGESLFELRAVRVDDADEIDACLAALKRKYDFEPDPDQRANAMLFRLEPRS
jgi:hypothetical protein